MRPVNLSELALVFAAQTHRPAIRAGLNMIAAMDLALPRQGTEEAQLTRLAWWDTELQRFIEGTPEHPAAQELLVHGLALLQAPYWRTLVRAQALRITTPNPDSESLRDIADAMGASYGAIATLLGATANADTYQQLGSAVWLIDQLCGNVNRPDYRDLMDGAAKRLGVVADELATTAVPINHRFAIVLAALYARTADRENQRPGAATLGPVLRLWIAWRAALRAR